MSKMFFTNISMISDHVAISKDDDDQKRLQMFFSSGKSSCRRPDHLLASNCKDDNQITAHFIQCNGDVLSFLEVGWDDDGLNCTTGMRQWQWQWQWQWQMFSCRRQFTLSSQCDQHLRSQVLPFQSTLNKKKQLLFLLLHVLRVLSNRQFNISDSMQLLFHSKLAFVGN